MRIPNIFWKMRLLKVPNMLSINAKNQIFITMSVSDLKKISNMMHLSLRQDVCIDVAHSISMFFKLSFCMEYKVLVGESND